MRGLRPTASSRAKPKRRTKASLTSWMMPLQSVKNMESFEFRKAW